MRGHYGNHGNHRHTTVGATPFALGLGGIGTIALAFILLGPFIGTAATVAVLRGDPSKRERPTRSKPRAIAARPKMTATATATDDET